MIDIGPHGGGLLLILFIFAAVTMVGLTIWVLT